MSYSTNYSYDSNGRLHQLYHTLPTGTTYNTLTYDDLGRLSIGYTTKYRKEFQYLAGADSNSTTTLVSQLSLISSSTGSFPTKTYTFSYDNLGNISQIVGPEGTTNYSYDVLSQLTQASRNNSAKVWNYSYDYFGNLKARSYAESGVTQETLTYSYGDTNWKDKLTGLSVTRSGVTTNGSYTYDAIGNPTSYFSPSDLSTWTMTWKNGRELATASNGTQSISYDYDVNGLRTQKTVNGVTHSYTYASGKLLRDEWTENDTACCMDFFYDYAGNPYVVFFSRDAEHQRFYYLTNLQGDVIGILNTSAQLVAEYDYDPYGNLISCTCTTTGAEIQQAVGQANPLRYRGYYFDQETGFYYLQSRYYDPALGRFINDDSFASTGTGFLGFNMFAYCNCNPCRYSDEKGYAIWSTRTVDPGRGRAERIPEPTSFQTMTEAAIAAGRKLNLATSNDNLEHATGIYRATEGVEHYVLGAMKDGSHDSTNIDVIIKESHDYSYNLVGIVHSHPYCTGHEADTFSGVDDFTKDVGIAINNDFVFYLASPTGSLHWLYLDRGKDKLCYGCLEMVLPIDSTIYDCSEVD